MQIIKNLFLSTVSVDNTVERRDNHLQYQLKVAVSKFQALFKRDLARSRVLFNTSPLFCVRRLLKDRPLRLLDVI